MKLDLSEKVKSLDGKVQQIQTQEGIEETEETYATRLAILLCTETKYLGIVKAYHFSLVLQKQGYVEIDKTDLQLLKQDIENTTLRLPNQLPILPNMIAGYILDIINKLLN